MPYVMEYETWDSLTEIPLKPRDAELKAIGSGLKKYHETKSDVDLADLRHALHTWKMSQGFDAAGGWLTNERNSKKAIETLDLQLFGVIVPLSQSVTLKELAELPFYGMEAWAEAEAKAALARARKECLQELFMGKKVVFRKSKLLLIANQLRKRLTAATNKTLRVAAMAAEPANRAAHQAAERAMAPVMATLNDAHNQAMAPLRAARDQAMAPLQPAMNTAEEIARELINEILSEFPTQVAQEALAIILELVPSFLLDLAATVAPYVSLVPGTRKAVSQTVNSVKLEFAWIKTSGHIKSKALRAGDPAAAAMGLLRMVERKRNEAERLALIYTTDVTVKGAAIAADAAAFGAPAVSGIVTPLQGTLTALARLSLVVFAFAREVYEKHKANQILRNSHSIRITTDLFEECPVMGCFFLACSDTSDIVNFLVEDIGSPGWQLDIETMVSKHVRPLLMASQKYIGDSRLTVEGLEHYKGTFGNPSALKRNRKKLQKKIMSKIQKPGPKLEGFGKSPVNPFASS